METYSQRKVIRSTTALAVYLLIVSLALAPLGPVFAQSESSSASDSGTVITSPESSSGETTPLSESSADASSPATASAPSESEIPASSPTEESEKSSEKAASPEKGKEAEPEPESMGAALLSQGSAAPGPGAVASNFFNQSQFKIDKNTGAARITYPIVIPPGRSPEELLKGIPTNSGFPYREGRAGLVGEVRRLGGNVTPSPGYPGHSILSGITPQQATDLVQKVFNPDHWSKY